MIKTYFLDSSALVKRYVNEKGSVRIKEITDSPAGNTIIISRITWVEVLSAFTRLQRENKIDPADVTTMIRTFRYDFDTHYEVIETVRSIIEEAGEYI